VAWGPLGLLVLAAADSAGLPAVGGVDALLIAVSVNRPAAAFIAAACAIAGSLVGSAILFGIARKGGEVFLQKYIGHGTGKRLHAWFEQYGLITVFVPAVSPLPLPMKIPVFCAGALEVSWAAFLSVVSAARAIRYFSLAWLAQRFGPRTLQFLEHHWAAVLAIALSLAIAAVILLRIVRREIHSHE
jgi:membrane protein YqaA with SNARE-associated domain